MTEQQQMLMVANVYEAMRIAAVAIASRQNPKDKKAWAKIVGHMLWPKKDPDDAGRLFADCTNPSRNERLDQEEYLWLKREAKRAGCHILHVFDCEESEYQPGNPIEPKDEVADLHAQIQAIGRDFKDAVERYERAAARIVKPAPLVR